MRVLSLPNPSAPMSGGRGLLLPVLFPKQDTTLPQPLSGSRKGSTGWLRIWPAMRVVTGNILPRYSGRLVFSGNMRSCSTRTSPARRTTLHFYRPIPPCWHDPPPRQPAGIQHLTLRWIIPCSWCTALHGRRPLLTVPTCSPARNLQKSCWSRRPAIKTGGFFPVRVSETCLEPVADILLLFGIETGHVVLEPVDPGADREGDANRGDDRVSLVEGLDLDLHLGEILLGAPDDDVAVAPVAKAHHDKRVDLGKHFRIDILGLLGDDAEAHAELAAFHGALAEDLGGRAP